MTDTNGNIDAATQAARDAADKVSDAAADTDTSLGATAAEIADDLATPVPASEADLSRAGKDAAGGAAAVSDIVTDKLGDVVEGAKNAASDAKAAAGKAADAATDAVKSAGAKLKGAADDVDFDELVAQSRALAGGWGDRIKQAYRERPGVVVGAAVGAVVIVGAIIRSIGRR
ncbi:hypothetical protein [Microbacterium terregens]|uniref:DUF3618 domain-containing protein n=1 Tax=Microbacterium terregens TaxID=69363 RepID=A0ABV5T338_9MICO